MPIDQEQSVDNASLAAALSNTYLMIMGVVEFDFTSQPQKSSSKFVNYFLGWPQGQASALDKTFFYLRKGRFLLPVLNLFRRPLELALALPFTAIAYAATKLYNSNNKLLNALALFPAVLAAPFAIASLLLSSVTSPGMCSSMLEKAAQTVGILDATWRAPFTELEIPVVALGILVLSKVVLPIVALILVIPVPPLAIAALSAFTLYYAQRAFEVSSSDKSPASFSAYFRQPVSRLFDWIRNEHTNSPAATNAKTATLDSEVKMEHSIQESLPPVAEKHDYSDDGLENPTHYPSPLNVRTKVVEPPVVEPAHQDQTITPTKP